MSYFGVYTCFVFLGLKLMQPSQFKKVCQSSTWGQWRTTLKSQLSEQTQILELII